MGKKNETTGFVVVDTDIFIDYFRGFKPALYFLKENDISFSAITEGELLSGERCKNPDEEEKVFHILSQFQKIPVDNPLIQVAGAIRRTYCLELPDAIIAATAIFVDAILVTRNIKDFERVKGLKIKIPY